MRHQHVTVTLKHNSSTGANSCSKYTVLEAATNLRDEFDLPFNRRWGAVMQGDNRTFAEYAVSALQAMSLSLPNQMHQESKRLATEYGHYSRLQPANRAALLGQTQTFLGHCKVVNTACMLSAVKVLVLEACHVLLLCSQAQHIRLAAVYC